MQCVILAAGLGKRMGTLTADRPKPLISVCGKPLLSHIIDVLPDTIDEVIVVVGYRSEMIMAEYGDLYNGRRMQYVIQKTQGGTAEALKLTKPLLKGRFLSVFADDLHAAADLARLVALGTPALFAAEHEHPERFGVIEKNADDTLLRILEKPENPPTNLVFTGPLVADVELLSYEAMASPNGERYSTDLINQYAKEHPLTVLTEKQWISVGYPEDIEKAEAILCPKV